MHVFDVSQRKIVHRLIVGPQPHGIAAPADARVVYLSIEANGRDRGELLWINPRTFEISHRMNVGREPHAIACTPDGRWIYVPCRDEHYWVIDAERREVVKKIRTGGRPHNTQASPDGRYMYLSPMGAPERVTIVDVAAGHEVVGEIPFAGSVRPSALSADNRLFFQHVDGLNGFQVADIAGREVIATVGHQEGLGWFRFPIKKLGWFSFGGGFNRCHGLAVRPDQQEIWSCCGEHVAVHSLLQPDYPQTHTIAMPDDVYWLTFSPDSRYAFVAVSDKNQVAMVGARTKEIVLHIAVGRKPKRNLVIALD